MKRVISCMETDGWGWRGLALYYSRPISDSDILSYQPHVEVNTFPQVLWDPSDPQERSHAWGRQNHPWVGDRI